MAHQSRHAGFLILGFFEKRFQTSGGTGQEMAFDAAGHVQFER